MKPKYSAALIILTVATVAITACTTAQIQKAGTTLAPILAQVAQDAANSYVSTGKVNTSTLAADALNGIGAIAQAYVGQSVTAAPLATGAGLTTDAQTVGQKIVASIPVGTITQDTVNQIFTAAAQVAAK